MLSHMNVHISQKLESVIFLINLILGTPSYLLVSEIEMTDMTLLTDMMSLTHSYLARSCITSVTH